MKNGILFSTVFLTALSAGFFFTWSISVILGTKKVGDFTYLETMQSINREILNPLFFIVFFGSLVTLALSTILQFNNKAVFWPVLIATLIYLLGTLGITALGNVPLNNELAILNLNELPMDELKNFRSFYESKWNLYHTLRTLCSMVSFILLLVATFIQKVF